MDTCLSEYRRVQSLFSCSPLPMCLQTQALKIPQSAAGFMVELEQDVVNQSHGSNLARQGNDGTFLSNHHNRLHGCSAIN